MANFLSTPLVVRVKILSYLTLKEHLILRQVCTTTRQWIDESSLPYHAPVTLIHDHGTKTFTRFLARRPPHIIKSIYIKNDSYNFILDPALPYFMHQHASTITSLRLQRFFPCKSTKEIAFFEEFTHLLELQLDKISIPTEIEVTRTFPTVFKKLSLLKIGSVKAYPEPPEDSFGSTLIPFNRQRPMGRYVWDLIRYCESIEFLGYPCTSKYFFQAFIDGRGRGEFGVFCDYVRERHLRSANSPKLKLCDFQNDNWDPDTKNALPLLKLGTEFGIKFLNVNANLFQYVKIDSLIRMYDLPKNAGDCILSFKSFNCLITNYLPSVEKIRMSASEVNTMLDYSCIFNGPKTFPNLKEIEIIIDFGFNLPETDIYQRAREFRGVQTLLIHFFYDTEMILHADEHEALNHVRVYENVHSLTIKFVDLPSKTMRKAYPEDLPIKWIVNSLPNLKKLTLYGWRPEQRSIYSLITKNFPKLEELVFVDCDNLDGSSLNGNGKSLVMLTYKAKPNEVESLVPNFVKNEDLQSAVFLNKASHHQQMTWFKLAGES